MNSMLWESEIFIDYKGGYNMREKNLSLDKLPIGEKCVVKRILSDGRLRRRMMDLGIVYGTEIEAIQSSPSGDPVAYGIRGAVIAIRSEDAKKIIIRM